MESDRGEDVVTVGEDVRLDCYGIADNALGRKASVIDGERGSLDDDTATRIDIGFRHELASVRRACPHGRAASSERSEDRAVRTAASPRHGRPELPATPV